MRSSLLMLVPVAVIGLAISPVPAAAVASNAPRVQSDDETAHRRLDELIQVWGLVEHFHPWLSYRTDLDWDAALIDAAPAVLDAENENEAVVAIAEMLARLGDPETRLEWEAPPVGTHVARTASYESRDAGVVVFRAGDYYALTGPDATRAIADTRRALPSASALVLDLRSPTPTEPFAVFQLRAYVGPLEAAAAASTYAAPGERRRVYFGYPSGMPFASGQYRAEWSTSSGGASAATGRRDLPTVVILNRHSALLEGTVSAQVSGRARVVFEGDASEVPGGGVKWLELQSGARARIRTTEAVFADGTDGSLSVDAFVASPQAGPDDPALQRALAMLDSSERAGTTRARVPATARAASVNPYGAMHFPSLGHRVLALARFWNVIEHFYPYHDLLDDPWSTVVTELAPRFVRAESALDYAHAVIELSTRISDSHAYVAGSVVSSSVIPNGYPPLRVRWIEEAPIVTAVRNDAIDARVGDVVIAVDGEDAIDRIARTARLFSASTHGSRMDKATMHFMNGTIGSEVVLVLRGPGGVDRTVRAPLNAEDFTTLYHRERTGQVVRRINDAIGYVDLDRLAFADVDAMFEQLAETDAIIFDMRGYPLGTAWIIAPRLASDERIAARFSTPMPGHASPEPAFESFVQRIGPDPSAGPSYAGRTVMLIDERSQSQAEHTGLYLRAANGTRFVGTHTAGANGEITSVTLPGGITVGFTGQAVRHPSGAQLQRIGLVPDVEVAPTIAGIREGRDEVLERAVELLREE